MQETLRATGDPLTDTQTVQAACDRLALSQAGADQGALFLDGEFRLSRPLVVSSDAMRPVLLRGQAQATLRWVGPLTDDYLIHYRGRGRGRSARIQGLDIRCANRCRGVAFVGQSYATLLRDCEIIGSRQVGVDAIDSYAPDIDCVKIHDGIGIAIRCTHASGSFNRIRVKMNGGDWPEDGSDRAAVILGHHNAFTSCVFEQCEYGDYPLMRVNACLNDIANIRFERAHSTECLIALHGSGQGGGRLTTVRNIHVGLQKRTGAIVKLYGTSRGTVVDGVIYNLADNIVATDGGRHDYIVSRGEQW